MVVPFKNGDSIKCNTLTVICQQQFMANHLSLPTHKLGHHTDANLMDQFNMIDKNQKMFE